ncbi:MAG: hypothetical protein ABSA97_15630 [Verrucomicrobiia bacterium]
MKAATKALFFGLVAFALTLTPLGIVRADEINDYYNYLSADLQGVTEALSACNNLTTTDALHDCLDLAAEYANLLVTDATALSSVSGFNPKKAKSLLSAAKNLKSAIDKASLQTLLTSNGAKQFKDVQKPISSGKKFQASLDKAFFPFSPAPWGLSITDNLTGGHAVGIMGSNEQVQVSINVPSGMSNLSYYVSETAYGVLTDSNVIPPSNPIPLAAGTTPVQLTFAGAGGGAAVVVVDGTGHIIKTRMYFSRGPITGPGGGGGTVTSAYDGVYNCTVTSWAPGMPTQKGPRPVYSRERLRVRSHRRFHRPRLPGRAVYRPGHCGSWGRHAEYDGHVLLETQRLYHWRRCDRGHDGHGTLTLTNFRHQQSVLYTALIPRSNTPKVPKVAQRAGSHLTNHYFTAASATRCSGWPGRQRATRNSADFLNKPKPN